MGPQVTTVTPNKRNTSFREGVMLETRLYIEPSALVSRSLIRLELVTNFSFHTYLYLLFIRDYQTRNRCHSFGQYSGTCINGVPGTQGISHPDSPFVPIPRLWRFICVGLGICCIYFYPIFRGSPFPQAPFVEVPLYSTSL